MKCSGYLPDTNIIIIIIIITKISFCVTGLQSLLFSGKLTRDILQEIIHFIDANYPFIGVESFLTILMPFEICIDYLIETQPDYLLNYAICAINDDQKWQQLLIRITMQCKRITQNRSQEFYETLLKGKLTLIYPDLSI